MLDSFDTVLSLHTSLFLCFSYAPPLCCNIILPVTVPSVRCIIFPLHFHLNGDY